MNKFWNEKDNEALINWSNSTSSKEELICYNKLLPRLKTIVRMLLHKHFNITSNREIIEMDCIDTILIKFKSVEFNEDSNLFFLVNVAIKNYLVTSLINKGTNDKFNSDFISYTSSDNTEDFNSKLENINPIKPIEIKFTNESDLNILLTYLRDFQLKWDNISNSPNKVITGRYIRLKQEISIFIYYSIEFLTKFNDSDYEIQELFQYIYNNSGLKKNAITRLIQTVFKISYTSSYPIAEKKLMSNPNYFDLDYEPNSNYSNRRTFNDFNKIRLNHIISN